MWFGAVEGDHVVVCEHVGVDVFAGEGVNVLDVAVDVSAMSVFVFVCVLVEVFVGGLVGVGVFLDVVDELSVVCDGVVFGWGVGVGESCGVVHGLKGFGLCWCLCWLQVVVFVLSLSLSFVLFGWALTVAIVATVAYNVHSAKSEKWQCNFHVLCVCVFVFVQVCCFRMEIFYFCNIFFCSFVRQYVVCFSLSSFLLFCFVCVWCHLTTMNLYGRPSS